MKRFLINLIISSLILSFLVKAESSNIVTTEEALKAANNWINLIIEKKGSWGGVEYAEVEEVNNLKKDEKHVGFFCKVSPQGFIIVSLRKEFTPIKAYASASNLDHGVNEGLMGIFKERMSDIIESFDSKLKSFDKLSIAAKNEFIATSYNKGWDELIGNQTELTLNFSVLNFGGGDILLNSTWHQFDPFNRMTPSSDSCDHTLVGCTATATAQVMNYWSWPPAGVGAPYNDTYDWANMVDHDYPGITQNEINAVAELSAEVGRALESTYTCDSTSAYVASEDNIDVKDVLQGYFRYTTKINSISRKDWNNEKWFEAIQMQINANMPVVYEILGHAIVCDGWQIIGSTKQFHMNFGWRNTSSNAWYAIDSESLSDKKYQQMQRDILPIQAIGSILSSYYYPLSYPYRYFNVDATASNTISVFESGQNLQFLKNIKVIGGAGVKFQGARSNQTLLYSRGDKARGIKIINGSLILHGDGGVKFP